MHTAAESARTQHLSFTVAGEEYAVPLLEVKELVQYSPVTRMPATAPAVRGVVNLRGRVVPVVDLALQFGRPETPITRFTCLVMLDVEEQLVGVMADAVNDVLELGPADIEPPPAFGGTASAGFLVGLGKPGARLVMLLDVARVLAAASASEPPAPPLPAPGPTPPPAAALGEAGPVEAEPGAAPGERPEPDAGAGAAGSTPGDEG